MPAPLGKTPTRKMPNIVVYGLDDSQATRGAIRFFRERRIVVHFVDLRKKPLDAAELRPFLAGLGTAALLDPERHGFLDEAPAPIDAGRLLVRIRADAHLLRLPLVRYGNEVAAGADQATWKAWLAARNRGRPLPAAGRA